MPQLTTEQYQALSQAMVRQISTAQQHTAQFMEAYAQSPLNALRQLGELTIAKAALIEIFAPINRALADERLDFDIAFYKMVLNTHLAIYKGTAEGLALSELIELLIAIEAMA